MKISNIQKSESFFTFNDSVVSVQYKRLSVPQVIIKCRIAMIISMPIKTYLGLKRINCILASSSDTTKLRVSPSKT